MKYDAQPFACELFYDGEKHSFENTYMVILPAKDGEMAVMHGHKPLVSELAQGNIRVQDTKGSESSYTIHKGIAQIHQDGVKIICNK